MDAQKQFVRTEGLKGHIEFKQGETTQTFELIPHQPKRGRTAQYTSTERKLYDLLQQSTLQQPGEIKIRFDVMKPSIAAPYGSLQAMTYLNQTGQGELAKEVASGSQDAMFWWIVVLLCYGFLASVLPVWLLLQPRDYINSYQLYFALGLLTFGLFVAGAYGMPEATIKPPPIRMYLGEGALPMIPFLFVTIACGAVSGFHSLVSSGTTVRQLDRETDALPIGFGAMLTEGALAILVIMACVAGLSYADWQPGGVYGNWAGVKGGGLGGQLDSVITGGANFLAQVNIPFKFGSAFLAVTIVAFAMTTLDSATRLLRFNVEEIFRSVGLPFLANRYFASLIAVLGIAAFGCSGQAGKTLWTMFGTTNQLLAGLTLLAISLFLYKLRRPIWFTFIPMLGMLGMTLAAMMYSVYSFYEKIQSGDVKMIEMFGVELISDQLFLLIISGVVLFMTFWLMIEAAIAFSKGPGGLEFDDDPPKHEHSETDEAIESAHLG